MELFSPLFVCPLSWEYGNREFNLLLLTMSPIACPVTPSSTTNCLWASRSDCMVPKVPVLPRPRAPFQLVIGDYHRNLGCASFFCFLYSLPPVPSWIVTQSLQGQVSTEPIFYMTWTPVEKLLKRKKTQSSVFPSPSGDYVTLLPYSHTLLMTYLELLFLTDLLFGTSLADNELLLLLHETGMNTLKTKFIYKFKEIFADFYVNWLDLIMLFTLN